MLVPELRRRSRRALVVVLLTCSAACGSGGGGGGDGQVAVTIDGADTLAVSPGGTVQLVAHVTGISDMGVTWAVLDGGGSFSAATPGLYSAPAGPTPVHVIAKSQARPSASAEALVRVSLPVVPGVLTVGLESSVDLPGAGASQATTFDTLVLVDASGTVLATGTPAGRTATVSLEGVPAGDAFLIVNGLTGFPVPVRLEDPAGGAVAYVGENLVDAAMGTWTVRWRIRAYPAAAGGVPVVGWSDGVAVEPALHAWVAVQPISALIEVRTLETGALLAEVHGVPSQPNPTPHLIPDSWVIGVHGAYYQDSSAQCQSCHGSMGDRAPTYAETAADNGWCVACHRGPEGQGNGFVDPGR